MPEKERKLTLEKAIKRMKLFVTGIGFVAFVVSATAHVLFPETREVIVPKIATIFLLLFCIMFGWYIGLSNAKGLVKRQYNEVIKELEREPSQRTRGYLDALMWMLGEEV